VQEDVLKDARVVVKTVRDFRLGLARMFKKLLRGRGLNQSQYNMMAILGELGEATMGRLAERLALTMGACTNLVDKLISDDLADRERGTKDRRVVTVRLTPNGETVLGEIVDYCISAVGNLFETLDPADRTAFITVLQQMEKDVNEHVATMMAAAEKA